MFPQHQLLGQGQWSALASKLKTQALAHPRLTQELGHIIDFCSIILCVLSTLEPQHTLASLPRLLFVIQPRYNRSMPHRLHKQIPVLKHKRNLHYQCLGLTINDGTGALIVQHEDVAEW